MKFKIKYADQIVGTLSILSIAALLFLCFFIGSKQKWFVPKHPYHTYVSSGSGVSENMSILYKGFSIGKTTKISMDEKDRVVVNFYISDEYIHKVTENSIIEIAVSPIGMGSSIAFHPGKGTAIIPDDSLIPEKASDEAKKLIAEGKIDLKESTDSITAILSLVTGLVSDIDVLVKDVSDLIEGNPNVPLAMTIYEVNDILESVNKFLAGDDSIPLSDITNQINAILGDLNALTANLSDPQGLVPKLLESEEAKGTVDQLFVTLNSTIAGLDGISNSLESDMPQVSILLSELDALLRQIDDVMVGLANNPLLKKGIPDRVEKESAAPKYREDKF